jgi:SAM-dependent methyltransferase
MVRSSFAQRLGREREVDVPIDDAQPSPPDFDAYHDGYREAVEQSIDFAGTGLDFFTRAKTRELLELALRRVGNPNQLAFLDVGCGPGETDRFLKGRIGSLTGVDVAPGFVERARERNRWAEYRCSRPGEPIPCQAETFDVSFAISVFHHVAPRERLALVAEMARVTKPGGLVAVFEHNPRNPLTRRAVARCEFDEDAELLARGTVATLMRQARLEAVESSFIIYFTRQSARLRVLERRLRRVPFGAQYVVSGLRCS